MDQLNLKKVLLVTNLIRALAIGVLILFVDQTYLLFIIVMILAVVTTFFVPAEGSAIPAIVEDRQLISANSLFSLSLQITLVVGFLVGGFALKVFGQQTTLFLILFCFILSIGLNLLLPANIKSETRKQQVSWVQNFLQGIVFVFRTKIVRDSIFFLTLTTTIFFVLATIGPGYVDKILNLDIKYSSAVVIAPAVVGMAVGAVILSNLGDRFTERSLINVGLLELGLVFLLISVLGSSSLGLNLQIASLLLIFLLGVGNSFVTIPVTTNFQKNTPEELRGRAYGLLSTFISGVAVLPVILSGALGDLLGVRAVLLGLGVLVFSFGIYRLRPKKVI